MPLQRRVPKRGFKNPFRTAYQVVNISRLEGFQSGDQITPEKLAEKGLIRKSSIPVKILGRGELSASLHIRANAFSKTAKEKIKSAGGKYEVI
jgi:large subunit ribosomal protein L15